MRKMGDHFRCITSDGPKIPGYYTEDPFAKGITYPNGRTTIMNTKDIANTAGEFLYAALLRGAVTDAITLIRSQVIERIPSEHATTCARFLETPVGDGIIRLALAGVLATMPKGSLPEVVEHIQQELFISSAASGYTAIHEVVGQTVNLIAEKLPQQLTGDK